MRAHAADRRHAAPRIPGRYAGYWIEQFHGKWPPEPRLGHPVTPGMGCTGGGHDSRKPLAIGTRTGGPCHGQTISGRGGVQAVKFLLGR